MEPGEYNHNYWLKNKERLSGRQRIVKQKWYKEHRLEVLKERKRYYAQNKEKVKEKSKRYQAIHKEQKRDYDREYNITHARERREYYKIFARKWRAKNPERIKEIQACYRKKNYDKILVRNENRRARLRGAEGNFTYGEWSRLKAQYDYTCLRCKRKEPEISLTQDHIIPLLLKGNNYISNIQPLCKSCNPSKGVKIERYI